MIDADMRAIVAAAHLCLAATVSPEGRPSLSPKGTIRVWDDEHLFFLDIASPGTRAHLARNPWIELAVVDERSRRGYRFLGQATMHRDGDVAQRAKAIVFAEESAEYPVECVVLVRVERALAVVSPGYAHVADERAMRALWRDRRARLDADYETYLDARDGGGNR